MHIKAGAFAVAPGGSCRCRAEMSAKILAPRALAKGLRSRGNNMLGEPRKFGGGLPCCNPLIRLCLHPHLQGRLSMTRVLSFVDSNHISHRLVLEEGDLVLLKELKLKRTASLKVTLSAASVDGDTVFVTHKNRTYDFSKSQLPD